MGPVGVGKSTMMSFFEGQKTADVIHHKFDTALYGGVPLDRSNHPVVIRQITREDASRKSVSPSTIQAQIDRALKSDPSMLCLDEPCAHVAHEEALPILERLKEESKRRAIVMVTHNSEHARLFADWMVLLGGGEIVEEGTSQQMFKAPASKFTKQFLKTGSMAIPRPDANARSLAPEFRGVPRLGEVLDENSTDGGAGVTWIIRNSFGLVAPQLLCSGYKEIAASLKKMDVAIALLCRSKIATHKDGLIAEGIDVSENQIDFDDSSMKIHQHIDTANFIHAELGKGNKIVALCDDPAVLKNLSAIQLIHMGITVNDAIQLVDGKVTGPGFSIEEEQFLWNLELVLDMESTAEHGATAIHASQGGVQ